MNQNMQKVFKECLKSQEEAKENEYSTKHSTRKQIHPTRISIICGHWTNPQGDENEGDGTGDNIGSGAGGVGCFFMCVVGWMLFCLFSL